MSNVVFYVQRTMLKLWKRTSRLQSRAERATYSWAQVAAGKVLSAVAYPLTLASYPPHGQLLQQRISPIWTVPT